MNKIYKVIWSKTRNCYVAVAEFVKRSRKGGSVLNRRHIAAALATVTICAAPVSALANEGGSWNGNDYIGTYPYRVVFDDGVAENVYGYYGVKGYRAKVTVFGGKAETLYGGYVTGAPASDNMVNIGDGSVTMVYGGWSKNGARDNNVEIRADVDTVYGGYGKKGTVMRNRVEVSKNAKVSTVMGGRSETGNVSENTVVIKLGNFGDGAGIYGGFTEEGDAVLNTVELNDINSIQKNAEVFGGKVVGNGNATGNTVLLGKGLSGKALKVHLYGGYVGGTGDAVTDNILKVRGNDVRIASVNNFENYQITLPKNTKAGDTLIFLSEQRNLAVDAQRVTVDAVDSNMGLNLGESVVLLKNAGSGGTISVTNLETGLQPIWLDGQEGLPVSDYAFTAGGDNLNMVVKSLYLYGNGGMNPNPGQRQTCNTLLLDSDRKATAAFGGRTYDTDVTQNKVFMRSGELLRLTDEEDSTHVLSGNLYGGYSEDGNARENTVEMSGGRAHSVYGGKSFRGQVTGNTVDLCGGGVDIGLYGGYSESGEATGNTVKLSYGEINAQEITAGRTIEASASGNKLTISGGTLHIDSLQSGLSEKGEVTGNITAVSGGEVKAKKITVGQSLTANVSGNKLTVSGGTVSGAITVGRSEKGNAEDNKIDIDGGMVSGTLTIGQAESGASLRNVATLSGGIFTDVNTVTAGVAATEATGNVVNLTATTSGLERTKLYGYSTGVTSHAGNELHVGGAKSYDADGNATVVKGTWQGESEPLHVRGAGDGAPGNKVLKSAGNNTPAMQSANSSGMPSGNGTLKGTNDSSVLRSTTPQAAGGSLHANKVDTVANFDSIVLHNVVWSNDVPALEATTVENVGNLDVTGLKFYTQPDNSKEHAHALQDHMRLIKSDSDLSGLNISYLDEGSVKTEALTKEGIVFQSTAHHTEEGGVTVDGIEKKRIFLADNNKSVDFFFHVDGEKITVGDVAFEKDGTARFLDGRFDVRNADIDAAGFKMTADSMKTVNAGDTMTVVDAEDAIKAKGATATLKTFTGEGVTGGVKKYDVAFSDDVTANLNLSGIHTDTLSQNAEQTKLTYTVGEKKVSEATMTGELAWQDGGVHYTNTSYNFNTDAKTDLSGLTFGKVTADPIGQSMTLIGGKAAGTVENAPASFGVTLAKANTTLDATAAGSAAVANGDVTYSVNSVTLDKVTVNQITAAADAVPDTWTVAKDATGKAALTIDTENMTLPSGSANKEHAILTVDNDSFAGATVTGQYAYASHSPFTKANGGVSIAGEKEGGVKLSGDSKSVVYHVVQDYVKDVTLGSVTFAKDTTLLTVGNEYEFTKVNTVNAQDFAMNYAAPENVAVRDSMTLLQANNTLQANALLQKMAADVKTKTQPYSFAPVEGVTVAAKITGSLGTTAKGDGFTYTVNSNQADSLTFGSVDWKDGGILLTRPANIIFAGAAVDTSKIHFKNVHGLDADKQMTLVSDFGNKTGKITGSKYYISTTLEGEGRATLNGNDLVFTTKTGIKPLHAQEQTHNTVMGMTAGISLLASGGEQIGQALNSLSLQDSGSGESGSETGSGTGGSSDQQGSNAETSGGIVASVGGGHMHQETGSHVTSNSWNGVLGIGGKRAGKKGTLQYLAFAEHGRANFALHGDAGRGDGTSKYVGGGLIGKWQNRRDVYVEASIRAGRMHDTASDMLYDEATGRSYGYDVHANYIGGHIGIGKVFTYNNGRNLDVYARYFHMKRDGVSFDAGGHFDLDSVTSSVLRVGARYGVTDKKWNWYGGLAYEYEFDGKSTGRADGAPIRAASMEGGSVRAEIGLRMEASKTSPWKADINLSGYAGKRRGISGNVAVAYTF